MEIVSVFLALLRVDDVEAQYRIDQWTADDGLPQNSVYEIVQTDDGYLWLATLDGLARFDGVRFTVFNKSNSPGIVNNRFLSLFEAASGDLWAGTEESGVVHFGGGRFEHFGADAGIPRNVNWIESDAGGNGVIFYGANDIIRFRDGKFSPFQAPANSPPTQVARSANRRIFCRFKLENSSSECFVNERWVSFSFTDGLSAEKFLLVAKAVNSGDSPQVGAVSAAQEADGNIWLITADGRLARAENGQVKRVYDERDGLPKYPMYLMTGWRFGLVAKDTDGSVWLVDLPSLQKQLLLKKDVVPPPLAKAEILSTYTDGEGNLWFGTTRDGLFRVRKQIITAYSEADGITIKNVYPIYEDRAGGIWVGATGKLFKRENETFAPVESTKDFLVNAIGEDAAGRILISNGGALYVQENNQFVPFERGKIPVDGFIYAIHADRENALWTGSNYNGLGRFKDGVLTNFTTADGLAGNDVKVIIEARAGGLWIGTYGGLSRVQNGKFTSWTETEGLPSRTIRALYEDADGTLWIGSYDGGLARFKDGKFTGYTMKTGLPNDGAFQILEDDNRNFWISSNRGIYRLKKDELNEFADGRRERVTSVAYGKSDGMLNAEANGGRSPAGIRARDGRLWFPTQDGAAVIDPREITINLQPPPVVIEGVKIDNDDVEFKNFYAETDKEKPAIRDPQSQIRIEPSQQSFEITYTALSFINSENMRFKYILEGLDDKWIDAGTRRLAYFSHVPPGEYTFRVIAANSDGVWNEQGATLEIIVLPPFYQTWWFLILISFVIASTAYLLFRYRLRQVSLKHAAELAFSRRLIDSREQERKRLAAELHDGLGQNLAIIKNRAMLGILKGDDQARVLKEFDSISESAMRAIEEVREITNNLRPHLLDRLGLTKAINAMLKKVSDVIEIESEVDSIDNIFSEAQEISIYRIVQESLNNVIKHSNASGARVVIKAFENSVSIYIEDDGAGFEIETIKSKSGFGLIGLKERTQLLNGVFSIDSKTGQGTKIKVKIPFPN